VNELFNGEKIKINSILKILDDKNYRKKKNIDDFCRLYIVVALCVFYFPRTSKSFSFFPFKVLENLYALHYTNLGGGGGDFIFYFFSF